MSNRIVIFGPSASGKSTLASKIAKKKELSPIHLDQCFWKENWTPSSTEEFREKVISITSDEQWVIEGSYSNVADILFNKADIIIRLKVSPLKCIYRALKRQYKYQGREMPFMAKGCLQNPLLSKETFGFVKWIWDFEKNKTPKFIAIIKEHNLNSKFITLSSIKELNDFIDTL